MAEYGTESLPDSLEEMCRMFLESQCGEQRGRHRWLLDAVAVSPENISQEVVDRIAEQSGVDGGAAVKSWDKVLEFAGGSLGFKIEAVGEFVASSDGTLVRREEGHKALGRAGLHSTLEGSLAMAPFRQSIHYHIQHGFFKQQPDMVVREEAWPFVSINKNKVAAFVSWLSTTDDCIQGARDLALLLRLVSIDEELSKQVVERGGLKRLKTLVTRHGATIGETAVLGLVDVAMQLERDQVASASFLVDLLESTSFGGVQLDASKRLAALFLQPSSVGLSETQASSVYGLVLKKPPLPDAAMPHVLRAMCQLILRDDRLPFTGLPEVLDWLVRRLWQGGEMSAELHCMLLLTLRAILSFGQEGYPKSAMRNAFNKMSRPCECLLQTMLGPSPSPAVLAAVIFYILGEDLSDLDACEARAGEAAEKACSRFIISSSKEQTAKSNHPLKMSLPIKVLHGLLKMEARESTLKKFFKDPQSIPELISLLFRRRGRDNNNDEEEETADEEIADNVLAVLFDEQPFSNPGRGRYVVVEIVGEGTDDGTAVGKLLEYMEAGKGLTLWRWLRIILLQRQENITIFLKSEYGLLLLNTLLEEEDKVVYGEVGRQVFDVLAHCDRNRNLLWERLLEVGWRPSDLCRHLSIGGRVMDLLVSILSREGETSWGMVLMRNFLSKADSAILDKALTTRLPELSTFSERVWSCGQHMSDTSAWFCPPRGDMCKRPSAKLWICAHVAPTAGLNVFLPAMLCTGKQQWLPPLAQFDDNVLDSVLGSLEGGGITLASACSSLLRGGGWWVDWMRWQGWIAPTSPSVEDIVKFLKKVRFNASPEEFLERKWTSNIMLEQAGALATALYFTDDRYHREDVLAFTHRTGASTTAGDGTSVAGQLRSMGLQGIEERYARRMREIAERDAERMRAVAEMRKKCAEMDPERMQESGERTQGSEERTLLWPIKKFPRFL